MLYSPRRRRARMLYSPRRRRSHYRARAPIAMGLGGMVMFGVGNFFGVFAASTLHRYSSTLGPTDAVPAGFSDAATYNSLAVDAKPSMKSIGWQAGFSLLSFLAAGVLRSTWAKLFFAGAGIGSAVHVVNQIVTHYVLLPLFGTSTWVMRAYAHQIQADKALYPAAPATTTSTTAGLPARMAPPVRALPAAQPARMPSALAAQPVAAARPGGARTPAPFPGATRASGLGQTNAPAPPAGMIAVANLDNGNCPDNATTVQNPANLDQPWCYAPAPPVSNTPPSAATPPPTPPPPATPPPTPPPVVVSTPTPPPSGMTPPPSQFTTAPCPPMPCPAGCQSPTDGLNAASNAAIAAAPPPAQVIAAIRAGSPCCGQSPCSCGCQNAMGAPPPSNGAGFPHPMFANLLRDVRSGSRRIVRAA